MTEHEQMIERHNEEVAREERELEAITERYERERMAKDEAMVERFDQAM
jgi:hypothetical protein